MRLPLLRMLEKPPYNSTLQCLVWEGQPMETITNPTTKNLTLLTITTQNQLQWNWIILGLRKEITKDIIDNEHCKETATSVKNLDTGKGNVPKGTKVTTIITRVTTTTTTIKERINLIIWRTPLLLLLLPLLLHLPITTIIWSLLMLKE